MASDSDSNSLTYSKVEISATEIIKIEAGRPVLTIQREQIRQIELCYDTEANHPFYQYFLGFILLFLGLFGLIVTFLALAGGGGIAPAKPGELVIPLVPVILWVMTGIGFWLLVGIFRARYNLCIETDNGTHRIFFDKTTELMEIRQFISRANQRFGYEIDSSILAKMDRASSTP